MEGFITRISVSVFDLIALSGTAIGIGYGARAMPDLFKNFPPGLFTYTLGSGYTMVVISFICALMCLIFQCFSCCYILTRNNPPRIVYQYIPLQTDQQYTNPLFQNNIKLVPPAYSSKA